MKMRRPRLAALALAPLLACQPAWGEVELTTLNSPPVESGLTIDRYGNFIEIPAGVAVVVAAELISHSNTDYESGDRLDFVSPDREIFVVKRRPSRHEFVFLGVAPGETCLRIHVNGEEQDCIPTTVVEPAR